MKIAIMGAGLAGLSCAVLLEKYGITPDVFEAQYKIGARFPNCEAIMNILDFPVKDSLKFIEKKYKVKLDPLNNLNRLFIHSPQHTATITGELGYITVRGNHPDSLEVQLGDMLKSPVITNSFYTLDDLKEKYDYVVVAIGNSQESRRQQIWETDVVTNLIGANIIGSFDPNTAQLWLNNRAAPKGYGFLLPYNSGTASLAIGVPGTEGVEIEKLWQNFLDTLTFQYEIKDTFSLHSFEIGRVKSLVKDNVIFVGNAGGFIMPFMGFGQFTSMLSGFEAAIAIANHNLDYFSKAMEPIIKSYYQSLNMRKIISEMNNNSFDLLVQSLKFKPSSIVFSKFPLPFLKTVQKVLDPFISKE
jgi:flavin-dependent dehydrogenase